MSHIIGSSAAYSKPRSVTVTIQFNTLTAPGLPLSSLLRHSSEAIQALVPAQHFEVVSVNYYPYVSLLVKTCTCAERGLLEPCLNHHLKFRAAFLAPRIAFLRNPHIPSS